LITLVLLAEGFFVTAFLLHLVNKELVLVHFSGDL